MDRGRFFAAVAMPHRLLRQFEAMRGAWEPVAEMPHHFSLGGVRIQRLGFGEGKTRRLVKRDAVAGDVHEEGPTVRELVIEVRDGVNDEVDRRCEMSGDRQVPQEAIRSPVPETRIGKGFSRNDDEQIIFGTAIAFLVLYPVTACIRAKENQFEDHTANWAGQGSCRASRRVVRHPRLRQGRRNRSASPL